MKNKIKMRSGYNEYLGNIFDLRDKLVGDLSIQKKLSVIKQNNMTLNCKASPHKLFLNETQVKMNRSLEKVHGETITLPKMIVQQQRYHYHQKSLVENMNDSKRKVHMLQQERIRNENARLKNRMKRVTSPLSRDRMNESFRVNKNYGELAKQIKNRKFSFKRIETIKARLPVRLPNVIVNGVNIKKLFNF